MARAPMLPVRDGGRAIEFSRVACGAGDMFCVDDASGTVVAQLSVEGSDGWRADELPEHGNFSLACLGSGSVRMGKRAMMPPVSDAAK